MFLNFVKNCALLDLSNVDNLKNFTVPFFELLAPKAIIKGDSDYTNTRHSMYKFIEDVSVSHQMYNVSQCIKIQNFGNYGCCF